MKYIEELLIYLVGKFLMAIGIGGGVVTVFFDQIARGIQGDCGSLQTAGLLVFAAIGVIGYFSDRLLMKEIMPIMKEYLDK